MAARRKTIRDIRSQYEASKPISVVTCYDATFARLVEMAEIEAILIGDSLGNVIQGHETTLPVTLEDIIYHTRAVVRANRYAHIIADMPFMSYQAGEDDAMVAAGTLLKEGGAQSVKLEGGQRITGLVRRMVDAGIPVCGHLGLTPQSVHAFGGFRVQATEEETAARLIADAKALEEAGAYMLVLEMVPTTLAKKVTESIQIPTIGIGAGNHTSGQVLVLYDLLGLNHAFMPKFVRRFADLQDQIVNALQEYREDVASRTFPAPEHSY